MIAIREETPADRAAIGEVHREAFGGDGEAVLVETLRDANLAAISLVAEEDGEILGHILLSWMQAESGGRALRTLALAPVAVVPKRQGKGIGSNLVRAGIDAARHRDAQLILVLGHPGFYRAFGFSSRKAANLVNPFQTEAFMALELAPDILADRKGSVKYPEAFGLEELKESP